MIKDDKPRDDKTPEFVINSQSPSFLHPLDSPDAIIVNIRFNEKNYDLWEQAIRIALKSKNNIRFIDGKISKTKVPEGMYSGEVKF